MGARRFIEVEEGVKYHTSWFIDIDTITRLCPAEHIVTFDDGGSMLVTGESMKLILEELAEQGDAE